MYEKSGNYDVSVSVIFFQMKGYGVETRANPINFVEVWKPATDPQTPSGIIFPGFLQS